MNNTFIITDTDFIGRAQKIADKFGMGVFPYENHNDDAGYHNWITKLFHNNKIDKLIIPLSLPTGEENTDGLLLGLHIRLNYEIPVEARCVPIVFLSNLSIENILSKSTFDFESNPQYLLFTDGVILSSTDFEEIEEGINNTKPLQDYNLFLSKLNIKPKATIGRHSVANLWGAFVLSKLTGNNSVFKEERFQDRIKSLYFKYILAQHPNLLNYNESDDQIDLINNTGKKVLLIDDEAFSCAWDKVFKGLFLDAASNFDVICEKVKDYKSFSQNSKDLIEKGNYDLFLLDLRMNGVEEEGIYETKKFSGYKILETIKNQNRGNQVIVFTASNKAWNLKTLIDKGANGYYIKESPEFGFSEKFSLANYKSLKKEIEECLDNSYLKQFYKYKVVIDELLNKDPFLRYTKPQDSEKYQRLIKSEVSACFNILKTNNDNRNYHALLMLYKIIEYLCKVFFDDKKVINNRFSVDFYYNETNTWYSKNDKIPGRKIKGLAKPDIDDKDLFSTKNKIFNIVKHVGHFSDSSGMKQLFDRIDELSVIRNSYVHGNDSQLPQISHWQLLSWLEAIQIIIALLH